MLTSRLSLFTAFAALSSAQTHSVGEEGQSMGPVALLWPPDRIWNAQHDNTSPCGSQAGPSNRTNYPLSHGTVVLTVADEAWNIALSLARSDNPTTQSKFNDQLVGNITEVAPGHQCYSIDRHEAISAGTNATIQLEYWSQFEGENNGNNESFFACADITFVETNDFSVKVPCFNVTSNNFNIPTLDASASGSPPSQTSSSANQSASFDQPPGGGGLSTSAKAGIAVGAVLGGLAIMGAVGFSVWQKGKNVEMHYKEAYELRAKALEKPPGSKGP
ncbi:hypothetical protein B5807_01497 [Epicoccum nigrum]|uniref:Copper acquisition factor BIM1-like domain-containing protein n=1 Tax=Epicoccum nigrum TaxID=105696 RepID=A0A1Y2MEF4_EPING|nr:hypothetical protein B5807_01497 [Epicoccum nigrum]